MARDILRFTTDTYEGEQHVYSYECDGPEQDARECPCGWLYSNAAVAERRAELAGKAVTR